MLKKKKNVCGKKWGYVPIKGKSFQLYIPVVNIKFHIPTSCIFTLCLYFLYPAIWMRSL